jgi:predicted ATP-dependent serine protease
MEDFGDGTANVAGRGSVVSASADGEVVWTEWTTQVVSRRAPRSALDLGPLLGRALPEGISAGEVVLIIGAPGVGKSRLGLSMCRTATSGYFFVSTVSEMEEELLLDLARDFSCLDRGARSIHAADRSLVLKAIHAAGRARSGDLPPLVVVDSLLGISSPSQQHNVLWQLRRTAKDAGVALIVMSGNHAVGGAAGPRSVLHAADYTVTLSLSPDPSVRLLTAVKSRRSSAPVSVGFEHTEHGLGAVDLDAETAELAADNALMSDTPIVVATIADHE